ncbi:hypothetical protein E2C01_080389 [Portunus trituberculatus]|uniref:Uncharacterized protein n=1 Tax=Portunus trituberculatus TaxID=210409 RepID=A0A5B7IY95_PORTR|nr:hypothetical protein [Portunus trituberculatus]
MPKLNPARRHPYLSPKELMTPYPRHQATHTLSCTRHLLHRASKLTRGRRVDGSMDTSDARCCSQGRRGLLPGLHHLPCLPPVFTTASIASCCFRHLTHGIRPVMLLQ